MVRTVTWLLSVTVGTYWSMPLAMICVIWALSLTRGSEAAISCSRRVGAALPAAVVLALEVSPTPTGRLTSTTAAPVLSVASGMSASV